MGPTPTDGAGVPRIGIAVMVVSKLLWGLGAQADASPGPVELLYPAALSDGRGWFIFPQGDSWKMLSRFYGLFFMILFYFGNCFRLKKLQILQRTFSSLGM